MATQKDENEVNEEDMKRICRFSNLNQKKSELEAQLENLSKELSILNDTSDEISIALSADDFLLKIGECYGSFPLESIEEYVNGIIDKKKKETEEASEVSEIIDKEMAELKAVLYAKLGDKINLDK